MPFDDQHAIDTLIDILAVPGGSGTEGKVADLVKKRLKKAGLPDSAFKDDTAHKRIPHDFERGNLIVKIPGTVRGPRRMFSGHMDTVPVCRGADPVRKGNKIVPKGNTGLGGDDRVAVAALVLLGEYLLREKPAHPPITLLFTVGEEIGLYGAKEVKYTDLGKPAMGFNIDGGSPAKLTTGAIGAARWEIEVHGKSAHAGVHPEDGVSATFIAARAIASLEADGWFGNVQKGSQKGSCNIGVIEGGEATNQITDHVFIKGESRSHSTKFVDRIVAAVEKAFTKEAKATRNRAGDRGSITFRAAKDYDAFRLRASEPAVQLAKKAVKQLGHDPVIEVTDGGLDANFLNLKGVPTVTLGAGQHDIHTTDEYVDIPEFLDGCRLVQSLATLGVS